MRSITRRLHVSVGLHAKEKKVKQTPVKEQEEIAVFVFLKKGL